MGGVLPAGLRAKREKWRAVAFRTIGMPEVGVYSERRRVVGVSERELHRRVEEATLAASTGGGGAVSERGRVAAGRELGVDARGDGRCGAHYGLSGGPMMKISQ